MKIIPVLSLFVSVLFLSATTKTLSPISINNLETESSCVSGFTGSVPEGSEYVLVWADEFDGEGEVCSENWFHQTLLPNGDSWFNGEIQHYTDRIENSFVEDGQLNIVAKRENFTDQGVSKDYTSVRLNSKFAFTYGRVDVRAKLPSELGTWPAIWTLGKNITEPGAYWAEDFGTTPWPATGEIDIMEQFGRSSPEKTEVHGTTHTPAGFGGNANGGKTTLSTSTTNFHIYSIIWDEDEIQFLVDDEEFYTYNPVTIYGSKNADNWPFNEAQFLILNIAMGGDLGGNVPGNFVDATMEIDYVRVYQNYDEGFTAAAPETAAEDPTEDGSRVISLFSDSFTSIDGVDLNPEGDQQTIVTEIEIDGNQIIKYSNLDYQPIDFSNNSQNLSNISTLHFDYWTVNTTQLDISLLNTEQDESAFYVPITTGCWVGVDIPLTEFSASLDLTEIIQLKMEGNGTIYLDNIYFVGDDDLQSPISAAPEPTNDDADVVSLFSETYSTISGVNYNPNLGQSTVAALVSINGNSTLKYSNLDFQGISFDSNPQDISNLDYLHIDYWTSSTNNLNISLGTTTASGSEYSFTTVSLEWKSLDILLSGFASMEDLTEVIQMNFSGSGTIFLDNIYFYQEGSPELSTQEISFDPIQDISLSDGSFTLEAESTSGLVVSFTSSSNKISIAGDIVSLQSPGAVQITANQAGNSEYGVAPTVSQVFCVNPAKPQISISTADDMTVLTSSSAIGNQWFLNGARLTKEIDPILEVETDGIYRVKVTVDTCPSLLSDELPIIITSTVLEAQETKIFPNPVSNLIEIRTSEENLTLRLTNVSGQSYPIVFTKSVGGYSANLESLPAGVYIVTLQNSQGFNQVKIIKN